MNIPMHKNDGAKRKMTKIRGHEATATTSKNMHIRITTDNKNAIKRPDICGNNHGIIKAHGKISRILYQKYTRTSKRKVRYPIYK